MTCTVSWCDRPVAATGLCITHYKQKRKHGRILPQKKALGSPSGHGAYGELTHDGEGRVLCHECGEYFESVGAHVRVHSLTAREYKRKHGLRQGTSLISKSRQQELSEDSKARVGTEEWKRLEANRNPTAASHARTADSFHKAAESQPVLSQMYRRNLKGSSKPKNTYTCTICGREYEGFRTKNMTCSDTCGRLSSYLKTRSPFTDQAVALYESGHGMTDIGRIVGTSAPNARSAIRTHYRNKPLWEAQGVTVWPPMKLP